jgi:hypothetical protein
MAITNVSFPEVTLYTLWQDFCNKKRQSPDNRIQGIHAGLLNRAEGPDFQGAEVEIDGIRYRGDVEIHLNRQDWFSHGHHLDNRYDRVVLHLVWNSAILDAEPVTTSKNLAIPTYSLQTLEPRSRAGKGMNMYSCHSPQMNRDLFLLQLQELALERLLEKGKRIQSLLAGVGKEQTLYQLMVRVLGSPNNSDNFQRFAAILTWPELQQIKRSVHPAIETWIGLFVYSAGFFDRTDRFRTLVEPIRQARVFYTGRCMPGGIWKSAGQRPWNSPLIRLLGLAHFIHQFRGPSLYQVFRDLFMSRIPNAGLLRELDNALNPQPSRFWQDNLYRPSIDPKVFWGRSVRTEIIGNILIPFFYQEALTAGSDGFAGYLEDFFLNLPRSMVYGRLKSYWQGPEWQNVPDRRFYITQALLKLQETFCQRDSCARCPLGRLPEID